jgi:hypothetical protein
MSVGFAGGICGHDMRQLVIFGVVASRYEVRIGHGFPFFPSLIKSSQGFVAFSQIGECYQKSTQQR